MGETDETVTEPYCHVMMVTGIVKSVMMINEDGNILSRICYLQKVYVWLEISGGKEE
jgi:hypothetical protein